MAVNEALGPAGTAGAKRDPSVSKNIYNVWCVVRTDLMATRTLLQFSCTITKHTALPSIERSRGGFRKHESSLNRKVEHFWTN